MSQDSSSSTKASVLSSTCLTPSAPLSPNLEEEEEEQFHFWMRMVSCSTKKTVLSNGELFVSSLMDFSHLGSSSPSTLYGDLPKTSVLMKPNSPRICSSVYSEVSSPDMEF